MQSEQHYGPFQQRIKNSHAVSDPQPQIAQAFA